MNTPHHALAGGAGYCLAPTPRPRPRFRARLLAVCAFALPLLALAQSWQPVPFRTAAMRDAGIPGGEGGQVISNIAVDSTGNVLLMGTDVGGLYRSIDGGANWQPANVGYKPRGATYVAIDPNNNSRFIAIGANGSTTANGANALRPWHGIWRSTDQGLTWSSVLAKSNGFNDHDGADDRGFDQVAFDPTSKGTFDHSRTIYWLTPGDVPAVDKGLWRSTDGGASWALLANTSTFAGGFVRVHPTTGRVYVASRAGFHHAPPGTTPLVFTQTLSGEVWGLAVSPAEPNSVWVAQGTVVKKNTNSGSGAWINLGATGLPAASTAAGAHNLERVQVSPANANHIAVRQHRATWQDFPQRVTTNGGSSWTSPSFAIGWEENAFIGTESRRTYAVAWHPTNANHVWNAGGDMIQKSVNGGVNYAWANNGYLGIAGVGFFSFNPHNPDLLFITTQDYNSASSTDGGRSWKYQDVHGTNWTWNGRRVPGWGGYQYGGVAITAQRYATMRGFFWGDWGRIATTGTAGGATGETWTTTGHYNAGTSHSLVHPGNANIVFLGNWRSIDGGVTWAPMQTGVEGVVDYDKNPAVPAANKALFAIGYRTSDQRATLYRSTDSGASWTALFTDTGAYDFADAAYDWVNNQLWVALYGSLARYDLTTGGWNWQIGNNAPANNHGQRIFKWVTLDPVDPAILYTGGSGDLYLNSHAVMRSSNRGAAGSWTVLTRQAGGSGLDGGREPSAGRVHPVTRELWVLGQCFGLWRYGAAWGGATANGTTNLAIAAGANATASDSGSGFGPNLARDNNTSTRWTAANGGLGKTWTVDLGQAYANLTKVTLRWEQSWSVYQYRVEVSPTAAAGTWTTVVDRTTTTSAPGASITHTFAPTAGRHVRVTVTGLPGGQWASLFEVGVY